MAEWGETRSYLSDDRDDKAQPTLEVWQAGNGDWYVAVVARCETAVGVGEERSPAVRICTSGGAASARPGLPRCVANVYRAMGGEVTASALEDVRPRVLLEAVHAACVYCAGQIRTVEKDVCRNASGHYMHRRLGDGAVLFGCSADPILKVMARERMDIPHLIRGT